ncbi:MAG: bifunctional nicotinamidase/pyrazinamidase [Bacteroidetes bacterium]|nr:bifunctional nicotinamidase/pyrazinamidase [Bacteroidota bacterium]
MNVLLVVDIQNDFLQGGALAVKDGEEILPVVNKLLLLPFNLILASKDWHPQNHGSFAENQHRKPGDHIMLGKVDQVLWPVHCVQNTKGSEFSPSVNSLKFHGIFYKGTESSIDSYSAFFDNDHNNSTGMSEFLKEFKVANIFIAGLTTDYCVKYTALDALKLGYQTYVIVDACKAVNLMEGDEQKALAEMNTAGVNLIHSKDLKKILK